jgi:hypothetical protein
MQRHGAGQRFGSLVQHRNSLCNRALLGPSGNGGRLHEPSERQVVPGAEGREFPSAIRATLVIGYWNRLLDVKTLGTLPSHLGGIPRVFNCE